MKDLITKMEETGIDNTGYGSNIDVQQEMQEKDEYLDVLMTERNLLQDQCSQLQIDLDRHRAVLSERDEALSRTAKGLEQSVGFVKRLEDDKMELMQNVTICQEKLKEAAIELSTIRDKQGDVGQQCNQAVSAAESYKQAVEKLQQEMGSQRVYYEQEIDRYEKHQMEQVKQTRSLTATIEGKEQKLEHMEEHGHKMQVELTEIKHDCDQMCQVMAGMQNSLVQYASREEETRKVFDDSKERVEQMKLERDQLRVNKKQSHKKPCKKIDMGETFDFYFDFCFAFYFSPI